MESLRSALFEDPLYVYVLLGVALLVLAVRFHGKRTRGRAAALLVPLALGLGAFLTQRAVVTDREQIVAAFHEIAADLEQGRTDALDQYLDDDYIGFELAGLGVTKANAVRQAKWAIKQHGAPRVKFTRLRADVGSDAATADVETVMDFAGAGPGPSSVPLIWKIEWVRRGGGWKIHRADLPQYGMGLGIGR